MLPKIVTVLWLAVSLPSLLAHPDHQRSQMDVSVRGNSFGLENFLFQPYDNAGIKEPVRIVKTKRVRPAANFRVPAADRGQTYGLENLSAQLYELNRLKPNQPKPIQDHPKRLVESTAESTKIKENFVKPESAFEVSKVSKPQELETPTQEIVTERIRKRIMMRRRRKRPSNPVLPEGKGEMTGNSIPKPVRIPIYPQVPKVVIRTKLPDQEEPVNMPHPVGVKSEISAQKEKQIAKVSIPQEDSPTTAAEKFTVLTTAAEKSIVSTTTEKPSTINLKAFLKQQTETLSLSELLQTQNLSLADLLRGNKDASSILKAKQLSTTTVATSLRRKQINRTESPQTEELLKEAQVFEVTTSRLSYNGFQPKIPRTKVSNPTNRPLDERQEDTTKTVKRLPSRSDPSDPLNKLNELRLKLRNFQKKTNPPTDQAEVTHAPLTKDETIEPVSAAPNATDPPAYKKNRIPFKSANNPELSVILPNKIKPEPEIIKRPERLTNWTNRLPTIKRITQKQNEALSKPLRNPDLTENENENLENDKQPNTTPETAEAPEDPRKPESKDELIELLKSGQNADRLQKILNARNMTIQELLDNREKPPLQMNISALFSSQRKQAPASTQPTLFDSLPDFEIQEAEHPDAILYDEPEAEESAPIVARVELMPSREPKQYEFPVSEKGVSQLSMQPDDLTADVSSAEDSALWKLSEKSMYYGSSYGYGEFAATRQSEKPKTVRATDYSEDDIILLETLRKNKETNRKFKLKLDEFVPKEEETEADEIEKSYIPPAVKSAIIASGVVMGIALFVFIAIFAACGWKQRQIRLKGSSGGLGGTLTKPEKSKRTLSPVSFKDTHSYKKTIDFDDEMSESGTSNASSYLWSTLKNTFTSRASTLKSRLEKDEKLREDKVTLRRNESRRKDSRPDNRQIEDEIYTVKKIDRDRNVINTSFSFKRSPSNNNINHFSECVHGY